MIGKFRKLQVIERKKLDSFHLKKVTQIQILQMKIMLLYQEVVEKIIIVETDLKTNFLNKAILFPLIIVTDFNKADLKAISSIHMET